ncbi:MAG: class I SAM-dependent methyltransferase [Candidatus Kerfeldbacteria bacterium]|nr:class I SAM-dependent methyltransferase [Candidatus Kerfeldbacteria bacterium]
MSDSVGALLVLVAVVLVFGTAAWAGLRAAPWVPTRERDIRRMLDLAELKRGERLVDLGCGDGRVLTFAARDYGALATGYEISLLPYLVAKLRCLFHPSLQRQLDVRYRDFYRVSLSEADVVFCFLTPMAMKRLKTKFVQELKPGARVVSYAFALTELPGVVAQKPDKTQATAYLYVHKL